MRSSISRSAPLRLLLVFGLAGAGACDSLLNVQNPATHADSDLDNIAYAPGMVAGVMARFQFMYDDLAWYSSIITDETVTGHNFETIQRVDLRQVDKLNSGDVYAPLQYTRAAADSFETRLTRLMPDSANRALGMARVQAYGAMTYLLMGEFLCEAPIEPSSPAIMPDSMFRIAISRANRAIATANAFKAAGGSAARGDSMINFARVAAARAHLNLGENAQAAAIASQVPAAFQLWSNYDQANSNNVFFGNTTGTNRNMGVDAAFRNLNDPRVRWNPAGGTGHDQSTILFSPFQSPSFSGYSPTANVAFARETAIRVVSGLEARYIVAEAQGLTAANVEFVNSRRAIGGQAPLVDPSAAEYRAALQDQRRRDFFLDGHRLGDLRRYIRTGQGDFFPTGAHPNPARGQYGTSVCFMPTQAEIVGNPGYNP
jgi:hypothetical protein